MFTTENINMSASPKVFFYNLLDNIWLKVPVNSLQSKAVTESS